MIALTLTPIHDAVIFDHCAVEARRTPETIQLDFRHTSTKASMAKNRVRNFTRSFHWLHFYELAVNFDVVLDNLLYFYKIEKTVSEYLCIFKKVTKVMFEMLE